MADIKYKHSPLRNYIFKFLEETGLYVSFSESEHMGLIPQLVSDKERKHH
jgi:hypothetical protein